MCAYDKADHEDEDESSIPRLAEFVGMNVICILSLRQGLTIDPRLASFPSSLMLRL